MLNCRNIQFALLLPALIWGGCKAPNYTFTNKELVSDSIRRNISCLLNPTCDFSKFQDTTIRYRAFTAVISEQLVETNAVAEFKLVNKLSRQKLVDVEIKRYRNELYFYEFHSRDGNRFGLLLAATFDGRNNCIGIGPMYTGYIGDGASNTKMFVAAQEYAIRKKSMSPAYLKKLNDPPELKFYYENILTISGSQGIRFIQVISNKKNKISGINKSLVFNVEKIFHDPNALAFQLTPDK